MRASAYALAAPLLLLVAVPVTAQVSNDRLCRAIGDTPNVAVPPRDRAFFQDRCECLIGECAYKGGTRHRQLVAAVKCKTDVNGAAEKALGHAIDVSDAVGGIKEFRVLIEQFCLRDRSGSKVLATVKPAIDEQKRLDEERKKEEAAAEEAAERQAKEEKEAAAQRAAAEAEKQRLAELAVFRPLRMPAHPWATKIRDLSFNGLLKSFLERYAGRRTQEQLRWQAGCIQWSLEDRFSWDDLVALSRDKPRHAAAITEISAECKKQRPEGLGPDLAP